MLNFQDVSREPKRITEVQQCDATKV